MHTSGHPSTVLSDSFIFSILSNAFHSEKSIQARATKQILNWRNVKGFYAKMLVFLQNTNLQIGMRQLAATVFKNTAIKHWKKCTDKASKNYVRENLLKVLSSSPKEVQVLLQEAVEPMVEADFPKKWPQLPVQLVQMLQSGSVDHAVCAMRIICIISSIELDKASRVKDVNKLFLTLLPHSFKISEAILNHPDTNSMQQGVFLNKLAKTLHRCNSFSLLPLFQNVQVMQLAVSQMIKLYQLPLPYKGPDSEEDPWWNAKKHGLIFICNMYKEYGLPHPNLPEYKQFSMWWMTTIAPALLNVILQELTKVKQGMSVAPSTAQPSAPGAPGAQPSHKDRALPFSFASSSVYMTPSVIAGSLAILSQGLMHNCTFVPVLRPHLESILKDFIVPNMLFTFDELETFDTDIEDFPRAQSAVDEDQNQPRYQALSFLRKLAGNRRISSLQLVYNILVSFIQPTAAIQAAVNPSAAVPSFNASLPNLSTFAAWGPTQTALHALGQISITLLIPVSLSSVYLRSIPAGGRPDLIRPSLTGTAPSFAQEREMTTAMTAAATTLATSSQSFGNPSSIMAAPFSLPSNYDSPIQTLFRGAILPILQAAAVSPLLKHEALQFVSSFAAVLVRDPLAPVAAPPAGAAPGAPLAAPSPSSLDSLLLVALLKAITASLDAPQVVISVAASKTLSSLIRSLFSRHLVLAKAHQQLAALGPASKTPLPPLVPEPLMEWVYSFLPQLLEKLFGIMTKAGSYASEVSIAIQQTVRTAGDKLAPYSLTVFNNILSSLKPLMDIRHKYIAKTLKEEEAKKKSTEEMQTLIMGAPDQQGGATDGPGLVLGEDDLSITKNEGNFFEHGTGNEYESNMQETAVDTLLNALYHLITFARNITTPTPVPGAPAPAPAQAPSSLPILFPQFEPALSNIICLLVEKKDNDMLESISDCYNMLCVNLLGSCQPTVAPPSSAPSPFVKPAAAPLASPGFKPTPTMFKAFQALCMTFAEDDELASHFLPTLLSFSFTNHRDIFQSPSVINPLMKMLIKGYALDELDDDEVNKVLTGKSRLRSRETAAAMALEDDEEFGSKLGFGTASAAGNGDELDDEDLKEEARMSDSALQDLLRIVRVLLIGAGNARLAASAAPIPSPPPASPSSLPYYQGEIPAQIIQLLFAISWDRLETVYRSSTKRRLIMVILLCFYASPFHCFAMIRQQTEQKQAIQNQVIGQFIQAQRQKESSKKGTVAAAVTAADIDAFHPTEKQRKKIALVEQKETQDKNLPTVPTIKEFCQWLSNEASDIVESTVDGELVLVSLLTFLSIPLDWYTSVEHSADLALNSLLPNLWQTLCAVKASIDKNVELDKTDKDRWNTQYQKSMQQLQAKSASSTPAQIAKRYADMDAQWKDVFEQVSITSWVAGMENRIKEDHVSADLYVEDSEPEQALYRTLARLIDQANADQGSGKIGADDDADDDLSELDAEDVEILQEVLALDENAPAQVTEADYKPRENSAEKQVAEDAQQAQDGDDDDDDDDAEQEDLAMEDEDEDSEDELEEQLDEGKSPREDNLDSWSIKQINLKAVAKETYKYFSLLDGGAKFQVIMMQLLPHMEQTIRQLLDM